MIQIQPLITAAQFREHVETALGDEALERLIDSASADIAQWCGVLPIDDTYDTPNEVVQEFANSFGEPSLRPKMLIGQVVELAAISTGSDLVDTETVLLEDEEFWVDGNRTIRRKDGLLFGSRVRLTYIPLDVRARRQAACIQLVKLEINVDPGTGFEGAGSWQHTSQDYEQQRQHILWSLCPPPTLA